MGYLLNNYEFSKLNNCQYFGNKDKTYIPIKAMLAIIGSDLGNQELNFVPILSQ